MCNLILNKWWRLLLLPGVGPSNQHVNINTYICVFVCVCVCVCDWIRQKPGFDAQSLVKRYGDFK